MREKVELVAYHRVNVVALFSVLLAGIILGALAHELVHVLLIPKATTVTWHIGDPEVVLSTCCLAPGEDALEWLAFLVQFAVLVAWVLLNGEVWLHEVRHEIKRS